TTVIRSGVRKPIDAKELVPGDIIELQAGDLVPADARIIESSSLQVEESALTGESLPVEKDGNLTITEDVPLGDRLNMVYSGCLVTNGRAKAIVVETGMDTEMGKIASLINNTTKLKTPLQIRLKELAKRLSLVAIVAGILIFGIGVLIHGETMIEMLMVAISLSVAAVPETLPVIVTLTLTYGVKNMVKKNTIIRRIPAVETIGNTSVICSDKTGTLTQNKMQVQKIWAANALPKSVNELFTNEENQLLELLSISNNATVELIEEKEQIIGDPTESAIIGLLQAKGITKASLEEKYPRVFELPFDSDRKLMTTIHKTDNGYIAITKGAFDRIPVTFSPELLNEAKRVHDEFAEDALRVISAAYQTFDTMPTELTAEALEHDLIFLGMVGMIDPPRPESRPAVLAAKKAGIKTVMITGDHIVTASAIAKEIGILEEGDLAITGQDLDKMNQTELEAKVRDVSVYARVSPEDKIRIVQAWQANGEIVAMTGDGVNDAPAIKEADIGIAMGISGTDVTKEAASMVLMDDNFATIVSAIEEGRVIYDNIRKFIRYLLSCNLGEVLTMFLATLFYLPNPLTPIQILFVNLATDGLPAIALGVDPADKDIMDQ
ncbi:MAG: HAD-IC family P-type ATPase, partial [Carnobacterium sp.]